MSATNTTPNIGLPSFIGTDKPSWLTDWNGAMSTIDTEVGSLKTDLSGDETRIGNLENSVSSLNTTVSNHTTSITALNTQVSNQGGTINTITSLIGNGTPTTTDQTIIGAINELHANQGDLTNLTTSDKTSFVGAINSISGNYVIHAIKQKVEYTAEPTDTEQDVMHELLTMLRSAVEALGDGFAICVKCISLGSSFVNSNTEYTLTSAPGNLLFMSPIVGGSATTIESLSLSTTKSSCHHTMAAIADDGTVTVTRKDANVVSGASNIQYDIYKLV